MAVAVICGQPARAAAWPLTSSHGVAAARRDSPRLGYRAPLARVAVRNPFAAPITRYGPGHRGVDLYAGSGETVRAAGAGTVRFAGSVAGRGVVVIAHADGLSTEYEPLTPTVAAGKAVAAGDPIGTVHGRHPPCGRDWCLHWGARAGGIYLDPLSLLAPLGPIRLLPWQGPPVR
ncbi:M23 family metallopeptidase [Jatrophihabitans telluris]|uniref:M23 family metallopeptidase n=1 Tax=Jatrophihabitans telluris TaxID=2038343 RepID=UPI00322222EC